LRKWGLQPADLQIVNLQQAQIISAFSSGNGTLAGVWAPNDYTIEDRLGGRILCTGKDAGVAIPGTLVVRADFAKSNPDDVARYLAVYLHAIAWQRKHPQETVDLMRRFYQQAGVTIPDQYLKEEITTRPTFTLDEQLKIMARNAGPSMVDGWYQKLGEYLKSTGTVSDPPDTKGFITDEFMKRVAADPKLKAFADDR
jgi:ABC-type nitrate/sulfonate/bicarbonate transport system substrate-binding protein